MSNATARKTPVPKSPRAQRKKAAQMASFARRIRAAGLVRDGEDSVPVDMDEFRSNMARRIAMAINTWHGCPEPLCRRHRGCMAPRIYCTNAEPQPERSEDEQRHAVQEGHRILRDAVEWQITGSSAFADDYNCAILAQRGRQRGSA